jgi:phosphofructokinase-like protein
MKMCVGILTGGGDCPGLNPVIRAVVRKGITVYGDEIVGILEGWRGLLENKTEKLDLQKVAGILPRGGTILKTSRTNPFKKEGDEGPAKKIMATVKTLGLDALIAVGGEDTLGAANKLHQRGVKVVGVPKTIDNDLCGTEVTFGFDTAINIVMEAIDRLHTTAESHNRVMVVEVMGRHAGWIAVEGGIAGGADLILVPEKTVSLEEICRQIKRRHARGKDFSIVVVSEGANITVDGKPLSAYLDSKADEFGHLRLGGIGAALADLIEKNTKFETRSTVLGHVQRGGSPTAFDRVLGTRFGIAAIDLVHQGDFGKMVALQANRIVPVPLSEAVAKLKTIDDEWYKVAETFFG